MQMGIGLLGRKVGMTQIFDQEGRAVPVTVVEAGPCTVVQKKGLEKDGYEAVQLGYLPEKPKRVRKPMSGHFGKGKVPPLRHLQEMRLHSAAEYQVGQTLTVGLFAEGEEVVVTGTSKGRGFQGGVIMGASFILLVVALGAAATRRRFSVKVNDFFSIRNDLKRVIRRNLFDNTIFNKKVTIRKDSTLRIASND